MRTNLTLAASAVLLASTLGVAQAQDTAPPNQPPGAAVGTPGAESKGNPIPVPDQANKAPVNEGRSATTTTPGEESKEETRGTPSPQ
jgi:hypothetical protein